MLCNITRCHCKWTKYRNYDECSICYWSWVFIDTFHFAMLVQLGKRNIIKWLSGLVNGIGRLWMNSSQNWDWQRIRGKGSRGREEKQWLNILQCKVHHTKDFHSMLFLFFFFSNSNCCLIFQVPVFSFQLWLTQILPIKLHYHREWIFTIKHFFYRGKIPP